MMIFTAEYPVRFTLRYRGCRDKLKAERRELNFVGGNLCVYVSL